MRSTKNIYRILILLAAIASATISQAQDINQTEYKSVFNPLSIRGNIGLHTGGMNISDNELLLRTGGSVAVILNHKLAVGVVGSTFAGSQNIQFEGSDYSMYGGFGGLLIEPIIQPHSAIHVSFPISIGGGEAAYFKDSLGYRNWDFDYRSHFYNDFVYIEPGINVEVNLTKFMRFGVTGSYMISNTLNTSTLSTTQLDGLSLSANLKLGWFK